MCCGGAVSTDAANRAAADGVSEPAADSASPRMRRPRMRSVTSSAPPATHQCSVPPSKAASFISRDRPKSSSFGDPSDVNPMLLGLMSPCRYPSALQPVVAGTSARHLQGGAPRTTDASANRAGVQVLPQTVWSVRRTPIQNEGFNEGNECSPNT